MGLFIDDGDCQVEAVITPQSKKEKQGRLPFQTLSTDSPKVNKKRKSVASPDCRSSKHPKVNTKENSFKKSEKGKTEDIEVIAEEKEDKNDSTTVKDTAKLDKRSDTDSSENKKTPGRGPGKHKKTESKVPVNPLTKFFKKIDIKDSKNGAQSPSSKNNEGKTEKSVETELKDDSVIENVEDGHENEDVTETKKDEEHNSDSEDDVGELDATSSSSENNETVDTSHLNETDNMDVDSDPNSDLDDSHDDNDDDSHKSDTDCKKTEHEDTDSKDDTSRGRSTRHITPAKNKLLDSKGKERKLTPKQLEKKLEIQKKREMRDKQREEREKKLQEERESRKREKEEKQCEREEKRREREEKEKLAKEQKRKEEELEEQKKLAELEQKQKEKEAKEEDRRKREEAKEEEKKRKEEEKLEAERKKQKAASNFVSFFVPKKPAETKPVEVEQKVENRNFMPFEVKADMRLAPAVRRKMSDTEKSKFDDVFAKNDVKKSSLYISELRSNKFQIRKSKNTWRLESNDDVVVLEGDDEESANVVQATKVEKHRAKLFLFEENRRPPYWGTWRKKSKIITPPRAFAKDDGITSSFKLHKHSNNDNSRAGKSTGAVSKIIRGIRSLRNQVVLPRSETTESMLPLLENEEKAHNNTEVETGHREFLIQMSLHNDWELLRSVQNYAKSHAIPLIAVFEMKFSNNFYFRTFEETVKKEDFSVIYINEKKPRSSNIVLLKNKFSDIQLIAGKEKKMFHPNACEKNNILEVSFVLNKINFHIISVDTSEFLNGPSRATYQNVNTMLANKPVLLIARSGKAIKPYPFLKNKAFTLLSENYEKKGMKYNFFYTLNKWPRELSESRVTISPLGVIYEVKITA